MGVGKACRIVAMLMLAAAAVSLNGCIKRTSAPVFSEEEFGPASAVHLNNPVGEVSVVGNVARESAVAVRTRKWVETYSLFGLADPDKYLDTLIVRQEMDPFTGVVRISASVTRATFMGRLFVRIMPYVDREIEAPAAMSMTLEQHVGNLKLRDCVGDIDAKVNVGEVKTSTRLGLYGHQSFQVDVGNVQMALPPDSNFRYQLTTEVGAIEFFGFDIPLNSSFIGAAASGVHGYVEDFAAIEAKVNVGNISIKAE